MSKERKSNREGKKKPVLTLKEKRAVKKVKNKASVFSINERPTRRPA